MTSYDHIAAVLIILVIIGWLVWRALDSRIDSDPQADAHGDWPRHPFSDH